MYYWNWISNQREQVQPSVDPAASRFAYHLNALKDEDWTVVQVDDFVITPASISIRANDTVGFIASDARTYKVSMKGYELFTIRGAAHKEKMTVSSFIFKHTGTFTLVFTSPDDDQRQGILMVTITS